MKKYDKEFFAELVRKAEASPRRRAHHTIHEIDADPIQRLFVALGEGTYFRPHTHPGKRELLTMLKGKIGVLIFDQAGKVLERYEATPEGLAVLEHQAGNWHCCFAVEPGSVFMEVKSGPFVPTPPEDFATWAPAENAPGAERFEKWFHTAQVGDIAPNF